MAENWVMDGHEITAMFHAGFLTVRFRCSVETEDGQVPPCRVDYDEDGEPTGTVLDRCNFADWIEVDSEPLEVLDRDVRAEITSMPLPVAVRWDGSGCVWAPVSWAREQAAKQVPHA